MHVWRAHTEMILGIEEIIEHIINMRPMNVEKKSAFLNRDLKILIL